MLTKRIGHGGNTSEFVLRSLCSSHLQEVFFLRTSLKQAYARFIDKAQNTVQDRTIQGSEVALLQSRSCDNWTAETHATMLPKKNTEETEYNSTTHPRTPNLHDNALRREIGAKRRRCRVQNRQGFLLGTLAWRGEPNDDLMKRMTCTDAAAVDAEARGFRPAAHPYQQEAPRSTATSTERPCPSHPCYTPRRPHDQET